MAGDITFSTRGRAEAEKGGKMEIQPPSSPLHTIILLTEESEPQTEVAVDR
jgi:hypothetical protein